MRADEVLDKAADKYESGEWSWYQYGAGQEHTEKSRCASEALWESLDKTGDWFNQHMTVRSALRRVAPEMASITVWNDLTVQNKEQVIQTMRRAAQLIRDTEGR